MLSLYAVGKYPCMLQFCEEREVYFRESACGHNRAAYFIGKRYGAHVLVIFKHYNIHCSLSSCLRMLLSALHFAAFWYGTSRCTLIFLIAHAASVVAFVFHRHPSFSHCLLIRHVLATPRTSVGWAFAIIMANVWCIYGLACLSSMIVSRKNAIMLAVVLCMIPAALCASCTNALHARRVTSFTDVATVLL
jgi:hypothetical protein